MRSRSPIFLRNAPSAGFTLIELLIVLGIIAVLAIVSLPSIVRSGLFSSRKSDIAGREVFEAFRAAKIYAATHNVETSVVYAGRVVIDSVNNTAVPIVDAYAIVTRMQRDDLNAAGLSLTDPIFEPLQMGAVGSAGIRFKEMENGMCILSDIFEVDGNTVAALSITGISHIQVWDDANAEFFIPRFDYRIGTLVGLARTFPAHRFTPGGSLEPLADVQRTILRVAPRPDADLEDRYPATNLLALDLTDCTLATTDIECMNVWFETAAPIAIDIYHHPDRDNTDLFPERIAYPDPNRKDLPYDIDTDIALYTATGRVKVLS